jgi:hypothetical protein
MLIRILAISVLWLCCSISHGEEAVEIPLNTVWAHMMPGTIKIQTLEPDTPDDKRLMARIGAILAAKNQQKTGQSFVVQQTGIEALQNAYRVFSGKAKPLTSLNKDNELSIVFFTHRSNYYVHLSHVTIDQNTIQIRYQLVPHHEQERTIHFALIPIGKLSSGNYSVEVIADPIDQKLLGRGLKEPSAGKKATIVSSSFSFKVA